MTGTFGSPPSTHSFLGHDPLSRARVTEILALADECTTAWNPVRTFGTGAGTMSIPEASKEMRDPKNSKQEKSAAAKEMSSGSKKSSK